MRKLRISLLYPWRKRRQDDEIAVMMRRALLGPPELSIGERVVVDMKDQIATYAPHASPLRGLPHRGRK